MSPEDKPPWAEVRDLFERALALDGAAREALLADPRNAPALVGEVRSLLRHHAEATALDLERPAVESVAPAPPAPAPTREGERLGAWRIASLLGRGGMGEVWLAERADGAYRGEAAIKVLKRGMDSESVLARFALEQQALARLAHPHIARLLDAGRTADGLPYFVMERVAGRPIDAACEGRPLEARLRLFLQLADAVAYAHRSLLVHRDLKPSNVMVDDEGRVKLLDFGIAKALDPLNGADAQATLAGATFDGERPFTPMYASPEQVRGEPVTTATDIYSLGVLLYVMLTGQRPYGRRAHTPLEAARSVLEEEPTRPSSLALPERGWETRRRQLQGDLDNVLLKTLEKAAERRYASVDALAADLQAYLDGRPVSARAASPGYVLSKFLRRHRGAAAAAALGGIGLVIGLAAAVLQGRAALALGGVGLSAGLAMALVQARRAQLSRDEAARSRDDAQRHLLDMRRLANTMVFDVNDALERGVTEGRRQLVHAAARSLERQAGFGELSDAERIELANALSRLAKLEGHEYADNLGERTAALAHYQQALRLLEPLAARHEPDAEWHGAMVSALEGLSSVQRALRQREAALAAMQRVAVHASRAAALKPDDMRWRAFECAAHIELSSHNYMVSRDHGLNRVDAALAHIGDALACSERLVHERPEHARAWKLRTLALRVHGGLLAIVGRLDDSVQAQRDSLAALERAMALPGGDLQRQALYPATLQHLALALERVGETAAPARLFDDGLALMRASQREDPTNQRLRLEFLIGVVMLMGFELRCWQFDRFDEIRAQALECLGTVELQTLDPLTQRTVLYVLIYGVIADVRRGRLAEAGAGMARLAGTRQRIAGALDSRADPNEAEMLASLDTASAWFEAGHGRHEAAREAAARVPMWVQHMFEGRAPGDRVEHLAAVEMLVRLARAPLDDSTASRDLRAGIVALARRFDAPLIERGALRPDQRIESRWLAAQP